MSNDWIRLAKMAGNVAFVADELVGVEGMEHASRVLTKVSSEIEGMIIWSIYGPGTTIEQAAEIFSLSLAGKVTSLK